MIGLTHISHAATGVLALAAIVALVTADDGPPALRAILENARPLVGHDATVDWRPWHYKIYATTTTEGDAKMAPMSVEETRTSIERLVSIYQLQVGTNFADKLMPGRLEKLERLAATSQLLGRGVRGEAPDCGHQLEQLNKLIEYNQPFQVNVVPFLKHNRRRLFGLCGDELYEQAEEALKLLAEPADEAQIGADFFELIVSGLWSLEELPEEKRRDKMAERVNELLERRKHISKDTAAQTIGDPTYATYYDQVVGDACQVFETKLRPILVEKYRLLEYGLDLFEAHPRLSKWLKYAQACERLTRGDSRKAILSHARMEFQDAHLGPGAIRG